MALFAVATISAYAVSEESVTQIPVGTSRDEIHSLIGEPMNTAVSGYKETYCLDNGNTAVLTYSDDMLSDGFIIVNAK